jgi:hypothetical protein
MKRPTLIYLFFDQYDCVESVGAKDIVVVDATTYAEARRVIENLKSGQKKGPITIIVRSRQFLSGFHDLEEFGDLINITKIAPREKIITKFSIYLPQNISDFDLIKLGIRGPDDLIVLSPEIKTREDFDDAVLNKAFGVSFFKYQTDRDIDNWLISLLDFLHSSDTPRLIGWGIKYTTELVQARIKSTLLKYKKIELYPLIQVILERISNRNADAYLNQLAVRYWLRSYPKFARRMIIGNLTKIVGQWQEIQGENIIFDAISNWAESFYNVCDNPIIEQVESLLQTTFESGYIDDDNINTFIEQTSGRFDTELKALEEKLAKLFIEKNTSADFKDERVIFTDLIEKIQRHFVKLSQRTGKEISISNWITELMDYSDVLVNLQNTKPQNWGDWLANYELLLKAKRLKNLILKSLPNDYFEQANEVRVSFSILEEKMNAGYSDWLIKEYPGFLIRNDVKPQLVLNAARRSLEFLDKGNKVIILALDGLDWELWCSLRADFAQNGMIIQGQEAGVAVIPTITEFSRRAIFGGLTPRNISNFVDDIYGVDISPQEEFKILARALGYLGRIKQIKPLEGNKHIQVLGKELIYANGSENDFRQALQHQAKLYAFVYNEIDSHIHVSKLIESELKDSIRQWLSSLVESIFQGIQHNPYLKNDPNLKIIVVSDHGFIDITDYQLAEFDKSLGNSLDLERHGRLAIVKCDVLENVEKATSLVNEYCGKQTGVWHIIWRDQSEQYGLAESSPSEGEIVAWIIPRLSKYVRKGRGNFAHGGLSMYETIVPFTVLSKGVPAFEIPVVTVSGELFSEEQGTIIFTLLNRNDRPFENLVINIPELGIRDYSLGNIESGSLKYSNLLATPPESGHLSLQIYIDAEVSGIRKKFEDTRVLFVQPGRRERMRKSTQRIIDDEDL